MPRISKCWIYAFYILLTIHTSCFSSPLIIGIGISGLPVAQKVDTPQGPYYFGFCIDLMNDVCENINKTCQYKEITLNNQFEFLNDRQIDLLILASPYTPFGLQHYAASIPYAVSKIQFVALKDSPIQQVADIKNKKIGVIRDTFYHLLIKTPYSRDNQIIPYHSVPELISDLAQHKVDVIVLNNAIAYALFNTINHLKLVGKSIPLGDGYGIIGLPDKEDLIQQINKAIIDIEDDDAYASIYGKYYQSDNH